MTDGHGADEDPDGPVPVVAALVDEEDIIDANDFALHKIMNKRRVSAFYPVSK